jgi:hypothetical protein
VALRVRQELNAFALTFADGMPGERNNLIEDAAYAVI